MSAIENPMKHQCALLKSSRKHFINAIEAYLEQKNVLGHFTAARETAEAADEVELTGWLGDILAGFDTSKASTIEVRYNEYNQICDWGLEDFDPNDPLILPGGGGGGIS